MESPLGYHTWVLNALTRMIGTWAIIAGVAVTAGGYERITGPSYASVAQVPLAPASWGIPLAVAGLFVMFSSLVVARWPHRRIEGRPLLVAGLMFIAVWSACFAIAFTAAIFLSPIAGVTGPSVYALLTCICCLLAVAHRRWG